jgi:hypothetical protein
MLVVGVANNTPRRTLGWVLIGAFVCTEFLANAVWYSLYQEGRATFPSVADLIQVVGALPLLVGVIVVVSDSVIADEAFGRLEVAVVGVAVALGVWLSIIEPFITANELPFGKRAWAAAIPLLGAVSVAVAIRAAAQTRFRSSSSMLLVVGLVTLLVGQVLRSGMELRGTLSPGGWTAALAIAPPLLFGAAALDPSMAEISLVDRGQLANESAAARIVVLSVAALTPLTVLLTLTLTDLGSQVTRSVAAVSAIVVVIIARRAGAGTVAQEKLRSRRSHAATPGTRPRAHSHRSYLQ